MDNIIDKHQHLIRPLKLKYFNELRDSFASQTITVCQELYEAGLENILDKDGKIACLDSDWAIFKRANGNSRVMRLLQHRFERIESDGKIYYEVPLRSFRSPFTVRVRILEAEALRCSEKQLGTYIDRAFEDSSRFLYEHGS